MWFEVDLILGRGEAAIEIKSTAFVKDRHLKGLKAFKEEHKSKYILVSLDPKPRKTDGDYGREDGCCQRVRGAGCYGELVGIRILQQAIAPDILPVHTQFFPDFDAFFAKSNVLVAVFIFQIIYQIGINLRSQGEVYLLSPV